MEIPRTIPSDVRNKLRKELKAGEVIRWVQQPLPRFFTTKSIGYFAFGIPWTLFALFWMWGASGFDLSSIFERAEGLFALFGLPFVLIGFGLLYTPVSIYKGSFKSIYAITNERAIIIEVGWKKVIRSYYPHQFVRVFRNEKNDGSGDLIIDQKVTTNSDGDKRTEDIGFFTIQNPKQAEEILRQLEQESLLKQCA